MSFLFREATATDIPALADLHVRTFNETHGEGPKNPTYAIRERQWRDTFGATDGSWFCFVIEGQNGELVGFAKGVPYGHKDQPDFSGELNKIYLLRAYHHQGLGRRLIGHVAHRFLREGASSMLLFGDARKSIQRVLRGFRGRSTIRRRGQFPRCLWLAGSAPSRLRLPARRGVNHGGYQQGLSLRDLHE
jgi:ribosomal protein S18 acetylase RimI-like enzyme